MKHIENDTAVREVRHTLDMCYVLTLIIHLSSLQVAPDVWIFSKPFTRLGIMPLGGRTTVIKLSTHTDGKNDLWILASTPLISETKAKVDELGSPK